MKKCVVTFCNAGYLNKAQDTIRQLINRGEYKNDIVLLVGDDLKHLEGKHDYFIVKYFPTIDRTKELEKLNGVSTSDGRDFYKQFQWHKIYCFDEYFKQWDKCLLIDAGMHIFKPIDLVFDIPCQEKILAHSDRYPDTLEKRNLSHQFESIRFRNLYEELSKKYNLYRDYFQTTMYLFDTQIITSNVYQLIWDYSRRYINTCTNEQAILNLVFNCEMDIWRPMPIKNNETYYYDFCEREGLTYRDYIMLKYPKTI